VIQVAMGWEGIHLYDFHLRAERYGSWEMAASSPDVTLAALQLRKGARFIYEYDLNIPWRHEVRIEGRLEPDARKAYPVCTGGDGACPPEDCGGPASFMDHRDDWYSFDALEDLDTMVEVLQQVALKDGSEAVALDQETSWRLEDALERAKAREEAQGRPFSRRQVNASFRAGEHRDLMHQQW
jgi:Plasmid pRiA4b ORF-3-like protein